jgi:hypothetical protein
VVCGEGHRFARNRIGIIDFTTLAPEIASDAGIGGGTPDLPAVSPQPARSIHSGHWRRRALLALSAFYAGFLLLLAPSGVIVGRFYQPFRRERRLAVRPR